jgi:16S rRNA (adenine1518-N6/adenine1519-N6)-dimethyltransferase
MEYLITVPPESFEPAPKVESAFVRCIPHVTTPYVAEDVSLFSKIVLSAFGQRRKTIRNTLKDFLNDHDFIALNLDSQLRAENLSTQQFVSISNYVSTKK